jgi:hypothetical protein
VLSVDVTLDVVVIVVAVTLVILAIPVIALEVEFTKAAVVIED